jgi:predicted small secreted protein
MKKLWIISILLVAMAMPIAGCATVGGSDWQDNASQIKSDVFMFSKLATRLALHEAEMPAEDVELVEGYLVAIKDFLAIPGQPNFAGARILAMEKLPEKYQIYGLTILDVLERYVRDANLNITEDQELIISIISSGINGALEAVQEFAR